MNEHTVSSEIGKTTKKMGIPFQKKRPTTIAEATKSLRQTIDDLEYVAEQRKAEGECKEKRIKELTTEKDNDFAEAKDANEFAQRLNSLFFGE